MDQLIICASLSHTHHYCYEVGMLKVPACTVRATKLYCGRFIYDWLVIGVKPHLITVKIIVRLLDFANLISSLLK